MCMHMLGWVNIPDAGMGFCIRERSFRGREKGKKFEERGRGEDGYLCLCRKPDSCMKLDMVDR